MGKIVCVMIVKDALTLDFCPYQTVMTALQIPSVSKFLINEGNSNDGTYELLSSIKDDRVDIIRKDWVMDKGFWARERNLLIDRASEFGDYVMYLDADEFLFKQDVPLIENFLANPNGKLGISFEYYHYVRIKDGNTPDCLKINKSRNWYQYNSRLAHLSLNPRLAIVGFNADDFVGTHNGKTIHIHTSPLMSKCGARIGHLGYARDARAAGKKFKRNDEIYRFSTEYLDGKLPDDVSFSYPAYTEGNRDLIDGIFPSTPDDTSDVVNQWIYSKHREVSYDPKG